MAVPVGAGRRMGSASAFRQDAVRHPSGHLKTEHGATDTEGVQQAGVDFRGEVISNMFRLKRLGVVLGLATGFALAATAPALAASATATATVNAGTLSLTTSAAPSVSVTLDGSDQT